MIIKSAQLFLLLWFILIPTYAVEQDASVLLLTPHYGVLQRHDLESYAKNMNIHAFNPELGSGIKYWQCFKSKDIVVSYRSWDDELTKETYCDMDVIVNLNHHSHHYGLRRAWPVEYCQQKKSLWKKIMNHQEYTCLGGNYISKKKIPIHGKEVTVSNWVFDKIKTKIGCNAYFGNDYAVCLK